MRYMAVTVFVLVLAAVAAADTIYLKDGSKLTGEIISDKEETIRLKMKYGEVTIQKSDIERIEKDAPAKEEGPGETTPGAKKDRPAALLDETYVFKERKLGEIPENVKLPRGFGAFSIAFSPTGDNFAYEAGGDTGQRIIERRKEHPKYYMAGSAAFSPDGKRFVYSIRDQGKIYIVEDGKKGDPYTAMATFQNCFSPDGKYYACVGRLSKRIEGEDDFIRTWHMLVNGKRGEGFDEVYTPGPESSVFLSDGRPVYVGRKGRDFYVVCGDRKTGPYEFADSLVVVDNGRKFCYHAVKDKKHFAVLDGKEHPLPEEPVEERDFTFSQDAKRYAYVTCTAKEGWTKLLQVVVDGKVDKEIYNIVSGMSFSPDSSHFAHCAKAANEMYKVILDGKDTGVECTSAWGVTLTADNVPVYFAAHEQAGDKKYYVVTGTDKHETKYRPQKLYFSSDRKKWIALAHGREEKRGIPAEFYIIAAGKEYGPFEVVDNKPVFSSDGTKAAVGVVKDREIWWKVFELK